MIGLLGLTGYAGVASAVPAAARPNNPVAMPVSSKAPMRRCVLFVLVNVVVPMTFSLGGTPLRSSVVQW
jgi:hypothetical protein